MRWLLLTVMLLANTGTGHAASFTPFPYQSTDPWVSVTKDSVVIFFPLDTKAKLSWNVLPRDTLEYMWIVRVGWTRRPGRSDIGLKKLSDGGRQKLGHIDELLKECRAGSWQSSDEETGEKHWSTAPVGTRVVAGGVVATMSRPIDVEFFASNVADSVTFLQRRLDLPARSRKVEVTWVGDPMEVRARHISGHLSSDEYAIYQTVLSRLRRGRGIDVILSPTTTRINGGYLRVLRNMGVEQTTRDEFRHRSTQAVELDGLAQIGFTVLDADSFQAETKRKLKERQSIEVAYGIVSRVAFNETRDQALVYVSYSCGNLCGEGLFVVLQLRGGSWHIISRRTLFVS